jgi:hypothetical protein
MYLLHKLVQRRRTHEASNIARYGWQYDVPHEPGRVRLGGTRRRPQ